LGGLTYLQFLAPGLLAATAMQSAAFESTFPIMAGLTWQRVFHAMYATPISPRDIVLGNLTWIAIRLTMISTIFTIVMSLFGAAASPLIILGVPAAVLTGMAFATPIAAFSATQRTPEKFNAVFRFGITPLFLFSGTFFPISNLPAAIQPIAWLSPLWHGVELSRALALGTIGQAPELAIAHVAVLVTIVVLGTVWAFRTIERRLVRG
jgi:lipooligosaccharide transport system permease protein